MLKQVMVGLWATLSKFEIDGLLKFITAICFITCLILSILKTLEGKLLTAVVLMVISFYSAYMNDKIMIPIIQEEEPIGEEE